MKEIITDATSGKVEIREAPDPAVPPGHVLVRIRAELISADTGPSAAGIVAVLGQGAEDGFRVGQRVAVAGTSKSHAELWLVPADRATPVPDDVNDEEACFGTAAATALDAVRALDLDFGDCAAVIGLGLVGQLAVQLMDLSGIRVIAMDDDPERLELARYGRAERVWNLGEGDPTRTALGLTDGRGCDGVLVAEAVTDYAPLATVARDRARVCLAGEVGDLPLGRFREKALSIVFPAADGGARWTPGRNLAGAVRRMTRQRDHRLAVEHFITHAFDFEDAEAAFRLVRARSEPYLGVVLRFPREAGPRKPRLRIPAHVSPGDSDTGRGCVLGVIGNAPLPPGLPDCRLHTIVGDPDPGFENVSAEPSDIIDDGEINALVIAGDGDHGDLIKRALEAGKHVMVEGPLAGERDRLNALARVRGRTDAFFLAGSALRFATMAVRARDHLAGGGGRFVLLRIKGTGGTGPYIDLARFLVGAPIAAVHAAGARRRDGVTDDLTITLDFTDGSLATLAYSGVGEDAPAHTLIEGYAGGRTVTIDDFRSCTVAVEGGAPHTERAEAPDLVGAAATVAFVAAVAAGGPAPVDEAELVETSLAAIAAGESLRTGATVTL